MRPLRLLIPTLALAAAGCVTTTPRVAGTAAPSAGAGYVGALSSKDTVAQFAFGLVDQGSGREYVIGLNDSVGLIELPPGRYRVTYWTSYAFTGERLTRQEIPERDRVFGRPFEVGAGQVVMLGKWHADRSMNLYEISSAPLRIGEAADAVRQTYPAFAHLPVDCILCTP